WPGAADHRPNIPSRRGTGSVRLPRAARQSGQGSAGVRVTGTGAVRAGIVGAGWIGRRHAELLASRGDVRVTAVCDVDANRAAPTAALSGAQVYSDWHDMLDHADLDALWICT